MRKIVVKGRQAEKNMVNIVKMNEVILRNNNHKSFENCTVFPITNSAGSRSKHLGNIVFWDSIQKREVVKTKGFPAYEWKKALDFKKSLGDKFLTIQHNIYQPEHFNIRIGEKKYTPPTEDYNGELDEFMSVHPECVGITWMDNFDVEYKSEEEYVPAGNYVLTVKKKDGKINFHLNPTEKDINALWVDLSSGELFHTENVWKIVEDVDGNCVLTDTIYSGGGAHHSNLFIGILNNGTKLSNYVRSYKGRNGEEEYLYLIKDYKLIEIPNL